MCVSQRIPGPSEDLAPEREEGDVAVKRVLLGLAVVLVAAAPALGQGFELRTWTTPAAAPANGAPYAESTSFTMRSRLGGPFVGHAESASFALWGCSAYTPVEGSFFASIDERGVVVMRWSLESTAGIDGFNVYRALAFEGPYTRLNEEIIPIGSPIYEDSTVWPGTEFWYELRAVTGDESDYVEQPLASGPVSVRTGGALVTALRPASPNPFTAETIIQHDIASTAGGVRLTIYDVAGRVVKTFADTPTRPGRYQVVWNGTNDVGQRVASGVYFCCLEAGGVRDTRPVVLLR